jgi:hypothetical protein
MLFHNESDLACLSLAWSDDNLVTDEKEHCGRRNIVSSLCTENAQWPTFSGVLYSREDSSVISKPLYIPLVLVYGPSGLTAYYSRAGFLGMRQASLWSLFHFC